MTAETLYDSRFFAYHQTLSCDSARGIIPLVLEYLHPASVVDVGCGIGTWLTEFKAAGIKEVAGFDGDYVDRLQLLIDPKEFVAADLEQPLAVERRFDLTVSLEVAEHLRPECASGFVASLARLAPVVLFSAAFPNQAGSGHVNEQPPEYWQRLFLQHDFVVVDCLRRRIWNRDDIAWWYRQNVMFFVERKRLNDYPRLAESYRAAGENPPLSFVHPLMFADRFNSAVESMRKSQRLAMQCVARLRTINLVAFPDWSQPSAVIRGEMARLLTAIARHASSAQITLVVRVSAEHEAQAGDVLGRLVPEVFAASGRPLAELPEISGIGPSFGPDQWEVVMACMQRRVVLAHEDSQAIAMAQGAEFPSVSVAEIEAGQALAGL